MGRLKGMNPRCWVKCLECGHRDLINRRELSRSARVRCTRCGGMVEPSANAQDDLVDGMDRRRVEARRSRHLFDKEEENATDRQAANLFPAKDVDS